MSTPKQIKGEVLGLSLPNFLQSVEMEGMTCLVEVISSKNDKGYLYFYDGVLSDAISDDLEAEEAAIDMLGWENVKINYRDIKKKMKKRINSSLMSILLEGAKNIDDSQFSPLQKDEFIDLDSQEKGEEKMSKVNEILEKFKDVNGFQAVGVFSPEGEIAGECNISNYSLSELGSLANEVLLKSQQTTEAMGVGRGNMLQIQAPNANIIARCLNEASDFSAHEQGNAHLHMVLILEKEGNLTMGKMKLNSVIEELAPHFR